MTRDEFDSLVAEQEAALDPMQRAILKKSRVEPWQAIIRRSKEAGDEPVWVVAKRSETVLYFDDVEWGWNWSEVSKDGRLLRPTCGQVELRDILGQ